MKILIFTEGTVLMHKNAVGHSRKEIIKQVKAGEKSVHQHHSFVPIGRAVQKLMHWKKSGAEILYLTSRGNAREVKQIKNVLKKNGFPNGKLFFRRLFRKKSREYARIVEMVMPAIFIEDTCESIGGKEDMPITYVSPKIKRKIKSIVVKEFGGIDFLPDNISKLKKFQPVG